MPWTRTARQVIRVLRREGWHNSGMKGSHRHFEHPTKPGKVTVPGPLGGVLGRKTMASILQQSGLRREDF